MRHEVERILIRYENNSYIESLEMNSICFNFSLIFQPPDQKKKQKKKKQSVYAKTKVQINCAKTKVQISCAVTAQLISPFVFAT